MYAEIMTLSLLLSLFFHVNYWYRLEIKQNIYFISHVLIFMYPTSNYVFLEG